MGRTNAPPNSTPVRRASAAAVVDAELDRCGRRLAARAFLGQAGTLLAAGAVFPLLAVVADHIWPHGLPRTLLTGAVLIWAVGLTVLCTWLTVRALTRRWNRLFLARLLERAGGIRHNSIINALLLRGGSARVGVLDAAQRQAARDVRRHPPARLGETPASAAPLAVAIAALLAWAVYILVSPKAVGPSLGRFLGMDLAAPTATRLTWLEPAPGDIVHAGEELRITVAVGGRVPDEVLFDVTSPGSPAAADPRLRYRFRPVETGPTGHWQLMLAPHEVRDDIPYRVSAGDGTLTGVIDVQPQPVVADVEIDLRPPAYTGWPVRTVAAGELNVLAGTQATFHLRANVDVRDAVFVLVGQRETRTRMTVDPDDARRFSQAMLLVDSGEYRIEFNDRHGYACRDPFRQRIIVRPDAPPAVEIVDPPAPSADSPEEEEVVNVADQPELVAVANDDVRVAGLCLVHEYNGATVRLPLVGTGSADECRQRIIVPTEPLVPRPGDRARVWFEVTDNRAQLDGTFAPQTAASRVITLTRDASDDTPTTDGDEPTSQPEQGEGDESETGEEQAGEEENDDEQGTGEEDASEEGTGEEGEGDEPTSQPAEQGGEDAESPTSAPADSEASDGTGEGGDAEEELERFIERHGEMARDVERRLREREQQENAGQDQGDESEQGQPTSQPQDGEQSAEQPPSNEPSRENPPEQPPQSDPDADEQPDSPPDQPSEDPAKPDEPSTPEPGEGNPPESANPQQPPDEPQPPQTPATQPADDTPPPASQPADEPDDAEPPELAAAESEGLAETIDLLEMLRRGEEITEDDLVEMGWSPPQANAFVKALERLYDTMSRTGEFDAALNRLYHAINVGDASVQQGTGPGDNVNTGVTPGQSATDDLGRIVPPPEQQVPAHLRAVLDAYYRALAERNHQPTP
ncbi:MAG: hypothetical protein PVJ57_22210 [Phycisphaerae bacterium]